MMMDGSQEDIEYVKSRVLRKFPLLGVAMSQLKTVADDNIETAATNGKIVYYSPKFFSSLSDEEKTFIYAHEVMHVAFNHILRSKDRNHRLWNIATDSVINQILKNSDLPMVEGGVDIAEAVNHSAEEMYEKLLKEQEQKKQQQQSSENGQGEAQQQQNQPQDQNGQQEQQEQQQSSQDGESNSDQNEQAGHDSHEIWKKAVEEAEKEEQRRRQEQKGEGKSLLDKIKDMLAKKDKQKEENAPQTSENGADCQRQKEDDSSFEKNFTVENEKERQQQAQEVRRSLERRKNETMKNLAGGYSYGELGESKAVVDWKKLLRKTIEEEEDRWSYRRSGADNDYMARVEELEEESKSETEVMLDVSGSVNEQMLKEFLRQLKPILKTSKLKVGCFDHRIFDFQEIKNNRDIDNFTIRGGGGTDIDQAVRAFSKKKEVNKIVFTDGYSDSMPREDLKKTNVIWLIYDNNNFNPVCGKVIYVDKSQIRQNFKIAPSRQNSGR